MILGVGLAVVADRGATDPPEQALRPVEHPTPCGQPTVTETDLGDGWVLTEKKNPDGTGAKAVSRTGPRHEGADQTRKPWDVAEDAGMFTPEEAEEMRRHFENQDIAVDTPVDDLPRDDWDDERWAEEKRKWQSGEKGPVSPDDPAMQEANDAPGDGIPCGRIDGTPVDGW